MEELWKDGLIKGNFKEDGADNIDDVLRVS